MALHLVTAPASEPITTSVAKVHLRVDHSVDDTLIDALCAAAREYVETGTRRKCITQTWDLKLDRFPGGDTIWLPFPPVTSVTSISYLDTNGDSQVLATTVYDTSFPSGPKADCARISLAYQQTWPQTYDAINAVTIRFVCGYASASAVPGGLVAAMKLLLGHWYANRESVVVGGGANSQAVPQGADALIWQYKAVCPCG